MKATHTPSIYYLFPSFALPVSQLAMIREVMI